MHSTSQFLTVSDVSTRLKVSERTAYRLISNGDLDAHRVGGSLRVSESDLEYYLNRCRAPKKARRHRPPPIALSLLQRHHA